MTLGTIPDAAVFGRALPEASTVADLDDGRIRRARNTRQVLPMHMSGGSGGRP